jgi:glycosyltransferase involved in cell wall biosynthesis
MPEFSICIPTYEYNGRGVEFLSHLFDTLEKQTFTDYEVIVSDHSQDMEIYNFCEKSGDRFDLKYLRNSQQRGSLSQNTNMCFRVAQGRILKPVYQDDFFYDNDTLLKIKDVFDTTSCKWVVTACNHYDDNSKTFYRDFYPNFDNPSSTLFGENLLSCPTVIALLKTSMIEFDENLKMLMDCEFYYRMYIEYGMPFLLNQILMTNRSHSGQSQQQQEFKNSIESEKEYCYHKHVAQNNYLGS